MFSSIISFRTQKSTEGENEQLHSHFKEVKFYNSI